jgi:FlgD Ig-like domain
MVTSRFTIGAFAALVAATVAAFFVTQHIKVTTPLINGTPRPVPGVIDPLHPVACGKYNTGSATISFYLQHRSDDVDVYVVDATTGRIIRTVASGRHMRKDKRIPDGVFHWDGRLADGRVAPDGTYYFRVALLNQGPTINLNDVPVKVKKLAPQPVITSVSPSAISGGSHVTIHYAGNETRGGTILLYRLGLPGGPRLIKTFPTPWVGQTAVWDGTVRGQRPAPPGTYLLALQVTDGACHTGRYPARIPPPAGTPVTDIVTVS